MQLQITRPLSALCTPRTSHSAAFACLTRRYVFFEPVWSNLLKILTAKVVCTSSPPRFLRRLTKQVSFSTLCWGVLTLATAWAGNYGNLILIRILLGIFEAGLFPCITVYLLMTYRREEIGRRLSYIFACSVSHH